MREYFCVNIPDLLLRTCWLDGPKLAIKVGDLVLFMKDESPISYNWKLGLITKLERSLDGDARIAEISYVNPSEAQLPLTKTDKTTAKITKRITRKSSHTIVKIHSIDDEGLQNNLAFLNKLLKETQREVQEPQKTISTENRQNEIQEKHNTEQGDFPIKTPKNKERYTSRQWIFIEGLPHDCSEDDLIELFNKYGKVIDVQIDKTDDIRHSNNADNSNLGSGVIEFEQTDSVERVLKDRPIMLHDSLTLKIKGPEEIMLADTPLDSDISRVFLIPQLAYLLENRGTS